MTLTGIIDIGSNSMRLSVIKQLENGGYYVVDEQKSSPRLANQLSNDGHLSARGVAVLIERLQEFRGLCEAYGTSRILAFGTAALRQASNRLEVVEQVRRALDIEINIVSGLEEATLGFSAVMHTLTVSTAYLVDIGGGSTEITLVEDGRMKASHSFPFGAVTLLREWQGRASDDWQTLADSIGRAFADQPFLLTHQGAEVIGIGGTIRTIARVHQLQTGYPLALTHNYEMTAQTVFQTVDRLAKTPLSQRKKIEGLSKERADLIVPGGAILVELLRLVGAENLRVSGRGLRDGAFFTRVLYQPLGPGSRAQVLQNSVLNTLARYHELRDHATHVADLARMLYADAVAAGLVQGDVEHILYTAAILHRIGVQVNYYNYDQHTFYLVLSSSIYGLSHREMVLAAAAASFKGRGRLRRLCLPYRALMSETDLRAAAELGVLVRLAEALDRRHERRVQTVTLQEAAPFLTLRLPPGIEADVERTAALASAPHVKKVYGRILRFE